MGNAAQVQNILFCSGRVYYDLNKERTAKQSQSDVAITRIEQVWSAEIDKDCGELWGELDS